MVAIIKKNFRLQNARDFLENLKAHPRSLPSGIKAPLHENTALTVIPSASGDATATYTWSWKISNTVDAGARQTNNSELKKDSLLGLKQSIGAHVVDRNHYLFIGKTTPWEDTQGTGVLDPIAELSPPTANDTIEEERRVWEDMLGLKKITEFYASLVIPRSDWDGTKRTIYRVYDDKSPTLYGPPSQDELSAAVLTRGNTAYVLGNFYALNSEFDLFVCLQAGADAAGLPTPSQEEPRRTQSPSTLIDYSAIDGYIWKYITTIKSSDVNRFVTDHWIPIRTLTKQELKESEVEENDGGIPDPQAIVQMDAKPGSVVSFIVDNKSAQVNSYTTTHTGVLSDLAPFTQVGGVTTFAKAQLNALSGTDPNPSSVNGTYNNMHLYITSGPGAGKVYLISEYSVSGTSREITLAAGQTWDSAMLAVGAGPIKYDILPRITVESNGTEPVKLKPVVSNGKISEVKVVDSGRNATYVKVTVDPTSGKNASAVAASVRAVLGPSLGLGADPEKDLGAYFVMLGAKLNHSENAVPSDYVFDLPVNNDYRQIGIIRDVLDKDENLATRNTYSACSALEISIVGGATPFVVDETIEQEYQDGSTTKRAYAKILDITPGSTGGTHILTYIQTPETGYTQFKHDNSGTTYTIRSTSTSAQATINRLIVPEIKKHSGEILYLENRRAILRAEKQTEDIKAIIEF